MRALAGRLPLAVRIVLLARVPIDAGLSRSLELLAAGLTNREIAQRLVVSARNVETHVARVTGKLGVNSPARAVARAVALRIVVPPAPNP